ncbi:MAG: 3-carboxy-cis,cis-muconate cycloisomerase [Hyphomicrobiaceae bacterium]|nr:3-carboxy-cis,cis-muconate cycloisomerase [Hyphomicrobiaceae bacterium]
MPSTVYDSAITRDAFGTPEMRRIFSDEAAVTHAVAVEVALARVQGRLGLVPAEAARRIEVSADAAAIDLDELRRENDLVGYPIIGLVHQLARQCGDAGRYLHWGATTQDIMDTASVLQIRAALDIVAADLKRIEETLAALARKHRLTVMAARTHLQHALPTTFGHKAAVWLSIVRRHRQRLDELRPRVLVVQLSGAAGTLASLGTRGLEVQEALAAELGLAAPAITWHAARDGFAEAVGFLALVTASLAKIATDVALLMQTEVAEAFEPFAPGRGSSSTMPQKRNPISCELIIAAAKAVRQHAGLMLDAVVADHERATGPWQLEWIALPESFIAAASALRQAAGMLSGLVVDAGRMRRNLELTGGLIVAEAVMMALAEHIGRGAAHDLVYAACRAAADSSNPLITELLRRPEVTAHLDERRLRELVEPGNYLGAAPAMVDRVLGRQDAAAQAPSSSASPGGGGCSPGAG